MSINSVLDVAHVFARQDAFTENYLTSQKSYVFSEVGVLIYVFDIESREFPTHDLSTYTSVIKALEEHSPRAHVFCLVHKMDLVQVEFRDSLFEERESSIKKGSGRFSETVTCYATTIWDQSLYKAWGNIVHSLIPNLNIIEEYLGHLAEAIEAEEVILFERATFLTVISVTSDIGHQNPYGDRYEKLSNIIKTFKHSLAYVHLLCVRIFVKCVALKSDLYQELYVFLNFVSSVSGIFYPNPKIQSYHR